jgi:hypothetical protein
MLHYVRLRQVQFGFAVQFAVTRVLQYKKPHLYQENIPTDARYILDIFIWKSLVPILDSEFKALIHHLFQ